MNMVGKRVKSYIPDIIMALILLVAAFIFVYPFWLVLVRSFNDPKDLASGGVFWWPRVFSVESYKNIFAMGLARPLFISISRTVLGIVTSVFCSALLGYVLAQKNLVGRKVLQVYFLITMYFSGGLIPWFLLIRNLGLINTFWVYIIPSMVSFYHAILMKVYIMNMPESMSESARIDGATEFTVYFRIILPLCKPLLATLSVFTGVSQWNSWFDTYIFNQRTEELWTLQMHLMKILNESQVNRIMSSLDIQKVKNRVITPQSIRMAITIITTAPIIMIYPFFQKYFIHGVLIGSVKE